MVNLKQKAGLSDIMSDIEDDKVADQMSISSISTPALVNQYVTLNYCYIDNLQIDLLVSNR